MPSSNRTVAALGLGLMALIAQPTLAQQADPGVQRTDAAQAQRAAAMAPAVIAAIDMERVINAYDRYKESSEKFKAEVLQKQKELALMLEDAKKYAEQRNTMKPGTPDYQKYSDLLTETQAQYEAERKKIAESFTIRESNAVADIYNDIRWVVKWLAEKKGVTFVVQIGSNDQITGENPDAVMAAVARNVVYHDPSADITDEVIDALNRSHAQRKAKQNGGSTAAPAAAPASGGN